jgi:hypothetical protein
VKTYLRKTVPAFALLLIGLAFSILIVQTQAQPDYLNEFTEPGDTTASIYATWEYVTQDGVQRTIDVYKYCKSQTCILVPFDIKNHALLTDKQATEFFENLVLREMLPSQEVTAGTYSSGALNRGSITCNLTVPRFEIEAKAYALQEVVEVVLPNLLPKNAAKIVQAMYDLGETAGVVKSATVPILVLGASCIGGDYLERLATSALVTCQMLLQNVRNKLSYEGQYEDVMNCHTEALQRLQQARYSPDILSQHLETQAKNILERWWTDFLNWIAGPSGNKVEANITESNYEKVAGELSTIQEFNQTFAGVPPLSQSDFGGYKTRIELKVREANSAITGLNSALSDLNSRLSRYTGWGGAYTSILNFFYTPGYNFSAAVANQSLASRSYEDAKSLNSTYRFNSAVESATAGIRYAANAISALNEETASIQSLNFWNILLLVAGCIVVFFMIMTIHTRRSSQII